jgi:hypothetical protein
VSQSILPSSHILFSCMGGLICYLCLLLGFSLSKRFKETRFYSRREAGKGTFVVSALVLPGFVATQYLCVLAFIGMTQLPTNQVLLELMTVLQVLLYSIVILASAAALQWQKVWFLLKNKMNLLIEKKALALCIVAILLVFIPMLLEYFTYDSPWGMLQAINLIPLWHLAYLFAACVFFLRAFRIR